MRVRLILGAILLAALVAGCGHPHWFRHPNIAPPTIHTVTSSPKVASTVKFASLKFAAAPPGIPEPGDVLYTTSGQWSGSPTGFSYAWEDCDSNGANCAAAAGSPTNITRYQIVSGDIGSTIRVAVTASYSGHPNSTVTSRPTSVVGSIFPLKVSASGRQIVNSAGAPFLVAGDSPQSAVGNLSEANWETYVNDRATNGFNTLWVNAPCSAYTFCASSGDAYDDGNGTIDIKPFTSGTTPANYDITTPNSTYFAKAHTMAAYAETKSIEVMIDPMDTSNCSTGFWQTMTNGGNGNANTGNPTYAYGQFIGNTFKDLPNVAFFLGNDDSCFNSNQSADNDLYEISQGIRNTDSTALQTLEVGIGGFDNEGWSSLDDTANTWSTGLDVNGFYSYAPVYAIGRHAFGQTSTQPTMLLESNYEFEKNGDTDGCGSNEGDSTARNCRLEEWWAMTSGATGQLYANNKTDDIDNSTDLGALSTTGTTQFMAQATFLNTIDWGSLAPDANGTGHLVTSGGGTCPTTGSIISVTCVTASINSAGTLALVYCPNPSTLGTITVDLTKITGTVTTHWVDPADGAETTATHGGTTSAATFTPSGNNSVGDKDWALLIQGT